MITLILKFIVYLYLRNFCLLYQRVLKISYGIGVCFFFCVCVHEKTGFCGNLEKGINMTDFSIVEVNTWIPE